MPFFRGFKLLGTQAAYMAMATCAIVEGFNVIRNVAHREVPVPRPGRAWKRLPLERVATGART